MTELEKVRQLEQHWVPLKESLMGLHWGQMMAVHYQKLVRGMVAMLVLH